MWGCVWVTGTTLDARHVSASGYNPARGLRHAMTADLPAQGAAMESKLGDPTSLSNRNDYAVALIYQGRHAEAIGVLEQLEQQAPGQYYTAANLGTALELAGRNEEALRWIQEGMRRNPGSHHGTEWLHARILEAKILAARDPEYFSRHSVLNLDHSTIQRDAKELNVGGVPRDLYEVRNALEYQLKERLHFIRTKDAPVAGLLVDYAALTAATHTLEGARDLLQLAAEFGAPAEQTQPLLARFDRIVFIASIRMWLFIGSIALLVTVFLIHAVKRGWIRSSYPGPKKVRNAPGIAE